MEAFKELSLTFKINNLHQSAFQSVSKLAVLPTPKGVLSSNTTTANGGKVLPLQQLLLFFQVHAMVFIGTSGTCLGMFLLNVPMHVPNYWRMKMYS